ncbi:MAG: bifunctional nuclease domain-containing protein [Weeksellaceae bacterium]
MDFIKLNIKGISYSQTQVGAYALILEEEFGQRKLPIIIGNFEAQAIAIALEKDLMPPRPLTHDLFLNFAKSFGIEIKSVNIYKLEEGIFYSNIICEDRDGELKEIDSRTSDAIALAVRFNAPIFVLKSVMDRAGIQLEMITESDTEDVDKAIKEIEKELNEVVNVDDIYDELSINELKEMMDEAAKNEDYERAAKLRDELDKRKNDE